jgi:hypothetical protein
MPDARPFMKINLLRGTRSRAGETPALPLENPTSLFVFDTIEGAWHKRMSI